jgi:predicted small lipoprotein YifL
MKIELRILLAFLACTLLTVACGQKGPLYLPGRTSTIESMVPEQQPATPEESEEDDDEDEDQSDNIN